MPLHDALARAVAQDRADRLRGAAARLPPDRIGSRPVRTDRGLRTRVGWWLVEVGLRLAVRGEPLAADAVAGGRAREPVPQRP